MAFDTYALRANTTTPTQSTPAQSFPAQSFPDVSPVKQPTIEDANRLIQEAKGSSTPKVVTPPVVAQPSVQTTDDIRDEFDKNVEIVRTKAEERPKAPTPTEYISILTGRKQRIQYPDMNADKIRREGLVKYEGEVEKEDIRRGGLSGKEVREILGMQPPSDVAEKAEVLSGDEEIDSTIDSTIEELQSIQNRIELNRRESIQRIQDLLSVRRDQMKDINRRQTASTRSFAGRLGGRFVPGITSGIVSESERQGVMRIAELDVLEGQLIQQANEAALDKDFAVLQVKIAQINKKNDEKAEAIKELNKITLENNKKAQEAWEKASREGSIMSVIDQGFTDPFQIAGQLNYNEAGEPINNISYDEIKPFTDALKVAEEEGIIGEWQAARRLDPEISDMGFLEYLQAKEPKLGLQMQKLMLDIQKAQKELAGLGGGILNADGKIIPTFTDSMKVNKEIQNSDLFKKVKKSEDTLRFLSDFEDLFDEYGLATVGGQKKELESSYNATILNLKEFFNLGVLNGPDKEILESILISPTEGKLKKFRFVATGVEAGIKTMKVNMEADLDSTLESLMASYDVYDSSSVAAIDDFQRIYIESKAKLNEDTERLVQENPQYTNEELIQIIPKGTVRRTF